jgi:hypothetical protein
MTFVDHAATAAASMPRTKKQRQQREKQQKQKQPQQHDRTPQQTQHKESTQIVGAAAAVGAQAMEVDSVVEEESKIAAVTDQEEAPVAAVVAALVEEHRDEHAEVTHALTQFGAHFIAPRTLKRIGALDNSTVGGARASQTPSYAHCPPVDLSSSPSSPALQAGDLLIYRQLELSPSSWTPELSAHKRLRVEKHDKAAGMVYGVPADDEEANAAAGEQSMLELPVTELSDTRLVEGPSFSRVNGEWRAQQRQEKKHEKWNNKQQQQQQQQQQQRSPSPSSQQAQQPPTSVAAIVAQSAAAVPSGVSSAAVTKPPRQFRSTNFSLLSNCVRALQQKQQQQQFLPISSSQPLPPSDPHQMHASRTKMIQNATATTSNQARSSARASSAPAAAVTATGAPPAVANASTSQQSSQLEFHLPTGPSQQPIAATAPMTSAASSAAATPADPSLSELARLLQEKKRELEQQQLQQQS